MHPGQGKDVKWVLSALCLDWATESIFSATDCILGTSAISWSCCLPLCPWAEPHKTLSTDYFILTQTHILSSGDFGLVSVPFLGCSSKLVLYHIFHFPSCKQHPKQLEHSCFFLFFFSSALLKGIEVKPHQSQRTAMVAMAGCQAQRGRCQNKFSNDMMFISHKRWRRQIKHLFSKGCLCF